MIYHFYLLFLFIVSSSTLQYCPNDKELIQSKDSSQKPLKYQCLKELKNFIEKRNLFYVRSFDNEDPISMICEDCDDTTMPNWYFISRNDKPLIDYSFEIVHGSNLFLLQIGTRVVDDKIYCLTKNNGLTIKSFDPERVLGTYYCSTGNLSLTNFIWHHVDTFYNADNPKNSQVAVTFKAYNSKQLQISLDNIEDELKRKYPDHIYENSMVKLFYEFEKRPSIKGLCGDVRLKYIRRCYFQIPKNLTESRPLSRAEYSNYFTILEAVKDIITYKGMSEKKDGRSYAAAKIKAYNIADSLGFPLKDLINDIVIPCHFSYFKHLESIPKMGNPFGRTNQYGIVETQLKCPEVNPMDIIQLAMARDIGKLKMQVLGEVQRAMRAIDKIYLQGSENEKLLCGFSSTTGDVCTARRMDIQWRKNDYVFTIESVVKQRVFVTENCLLLFTKMRLRDRGSYHCYRRGMDKKSWNISPTTKFLVQVERAKNPLPDFKEVMKYFAILVLWTGFLFILWVVLTVINLRIKINARYRAEERKLLLLTQTRRRQQTDVRAATIYKPNVALNEEITYDKKVE